MTGGSESSAENHSPVQDVLRQHIPFILLGIGLVFLFVAGVVAFSSRSEDAAVVFQTQEESSRSARLIRVDVAGAVMHPGVYSFPDGSRIEDALTAASGIAENADDDWIAKNLNRAAKLADGGKIYVPSRGEQKAGMVAGVEMQNFASLPTLVNINHAGQGDLEALPGIGPATAGKIIAGRPYQTIEELKTKKIVGNAVFEKIKDLITL